MKFALWPGLRGLYAPGMKRTICLLGRVLYLFAATEEEARAIADADPSAKAGLNRMEVAEMKIAFLQRGK
jgi:hypothetical protein